MKKTKFILPFCILLSLTSCGGGFDNPPQETKVEKHIHTFSDKYSYDDNFHWFPATCEHKNQITNLGQHTFGEWKTEKEATVFEEGVKARVCSVCGYSQKGKIEKDTIKGTTINNPLTIDEAIKYLKSLQGDISDKEFYVTGVVNSQISNPIDGYTLYFESDDEPFVFYHGFTIENLEGFKDGNTFDGATVKVKGYLKKMSLTGFDGCVYAVSFLDENESPIGCSIFPSIVEATNVKDSPINEHTHTYSDAWEKSETHHWHASTCGHYVTSNNEEHTFTSWVVDYPATETTEGLEHRTCYVCNYVDERKIDKLNSSTEKTFTVYTFNDFHGAVTEKSSQSHIGLAKFGTYLKQASSKENVLIIDSGDTFQGSIESNYNNGAMITDVFNYAHVDVHTLGNHDFDWGEDKIENNKARKYSGDNWHMTNLGANIYDYTFSSHIEGNTQQSRLGDKYYIKTLDNGIKVGVVGVIGRDQITSICSPLVEDICFKEHIQILKDLSDELRNDKGCDVVIASIHDGGADTIGKGLADVSTVSGKKYYDYVACGHSHSNEYLTENGVYYTQAAANGECIYKAEFTYENSEITNCDVTCLDYSTVTSAVSTVDPNITSIMNSYAAEYSSVGGEVIASSTSGTFYKNNQMPNLLSKAMYVTANNQGYNVDMACTNVARFDVSGSSWKYSQLYEAFPFDNVIYIVKIKGSKNLKEACYSGNYCYHDSSLTSMNADTWYTIAVIDYLLWHTNSSRNYDYFSHSSSYMQVLGTLKNSNGDNFLYRDVCANYVRGLSGTIRNSDYNKSNTEFTKPTVNE